MVTKVSYTRCHVADAILALIKLDTLGNARNAKLDVLNANSENVVLKEMFRLTYDWETTFGVSAPPSLPAPNNTPGFKSAQDEWEAFCELADKLATRVFRGNDARDRVNEFLSACCMPQAEWFRRIIDRDLRVSVTASSVQKVWPGVIRQFKVQLAQSLDACKDKVTFPVGVEPKYDGMRAIIVINKGCGAVYSRAGHDLPNVQFIADFIAERTSVPCVIDGELFGTSWNDTLKYVKTTKNLTSEMEKYLLENVKFYAFDIMGINEFYNGECKRAFHSPQQSRRAKLLEWFEAVDCAPDNCPVALVPLHIVSSFEEIDALYDVLLQEGYEGVMVKQLAAPYKGKRTTGWLKYKPFVSIDCVIVDTLPGRQNTRLENTLGKFSVDHDGVQFNVGSGFSDEDRDAFWAIRDTLPGRYVEVKVNKDFGKKESKVNFPVYMRMRPDKDGV